MTTHLLTADRNFSKADKSFKQMELQLFVAMLCEETSREYHHVAKLRTPTPSETPENVIH